MSKTKKTDGLRELRFSSLSVEHRAGDDDNPSKITGYAAVFDSPTDLGWFTEQIARGAFSDAIKEDDVRALVDHDPSRIIGRTRSGTLVLKEDQHGLKMEITPPDTTVGRDILESVSRRDIDGASFSFQVLDDRWEKKDGKDFRTIERVKLFDVGPVTFPAYEDTTVSVRSWDKWREEQEAEQELIVGQAGGPSDLELKTRRTRLHELDA